MVPLSVLDLSPIIQGGDAGQSLRNSLDLARHAEEWGYNRFWLAEHHNFAGVASAATAVSIGFVAAGTSTIRVGAGGIMLPNHAPLMVAEAFGTLASLYPGRIDLGLGRAPGTDPLTAQALRRNLQGDVNAFPNDVIELINYFGPDQPGQRVRAIPGVGLEVPVWILGSSLFGAQLAAALGLPFAFASHFAPAQMEQAIEIYRARYQPSARWPKSYLMLGLVVIAAESDREAVRLSSSLKQSYVNMQTGGPGALPPPVHNIDEVLDANGRAMVAQRIERAVIGSPDTVRRGLKDFIARTGADELMITGQIFDHNARLRSFEIAAAAHAAA
jgi:luciferase family oxidoreductase group 1